MSEISEEIKEKVIGPFKTKTRFIEFVSLRGNVNFITDEAFIQGKFLSGLDIDDVKFKLTICDEGTVNLEEVGDGNRTTEEQRGRLVDVIFDKEIIPYGKSMVVYGIDFESVTELRGKTIPLYLSVEYQTPIARLASLFEDEVEMTEEQESKLDSLLSFFDEDELEIEPEIEPTKTIDPEPVSEVIDIEESIESDYQRRTRETFESMKIEKIKELKTRIEQQSKEVSRYENEKFQTDKKIQEAKSDIELLISRLESMEPTLEPNGYYFFVTEKLSDKLTLEEDIATKIREKVSKVRGINVETFMKMFDNSEYGIKIGQKADGEFTEVTDYNSLPEDIKKSLKSLTIFGEDDQLKYVGEFEWHDLVDKLIKLGFSQDPEFDKMSGSNSFTMTDTLTGSKGQVSDDELMGQLMAASIGIDLRNVENINGVKNSLYDPNNIKSKIEDVDDEDLDEEDKYEETDSEESEEIKQDFKELNGYEIGDDYIFNIIEHQGDPGFANICLSIQPLSVWKNEGRQYDQHVSVDAGGLLSLPQQFDEVEESTFAYLGKRVEDAIFQLIMSGVKFNVGYQEFAESYVSQQPFTVNGVLLKDFIKQNYPNNLI